MDTASPSNATRCRQQQQQQPVTSRTAISDEADTRALFAALDKDANGFIDKHELRSTMSDVGLHLTDDADPQQHPDLVSDVDLELDLDPDPGEHLTDDDVHTMMKAAGVVIKDRIFYEGIIECINVPGHVAALYVGAVTSQSLRSRSPCCGYNLA